MDYYPTQKEGFLVTYWPADPFDGIPIIASNLPYEVQVSCCFGQAELNQKQQFQGSCWEVTQYGTICKVSHKFMETLRVHNQLVTEYIAARVSGYSGNVQRINELAQKDHILRQKLFEIDESFQLISGELEAG